MCRNGYLGASGQKTDLTSHNLDFLLNGHISTIG